jgi:hypothetical protein
MKEEKAPLAFLLRLNPELANKEGKGQPNTPPGFTPSVPNSGDLVSEDGIEAPE